MTVRELIGYLEKCDQDQECYIVDNLYDGLGINIVTGWEKEEDD